MKVSNTDIIDTLTDEKKLNCCLIQGWCFKKSLTTVPKAKIDGTMSMFRLPWGNQRDTEKKKSFTFANWEVRIRFPDGPHNILVLFLDFYITYLFSPNLTLDPLLSQ